MRAVPPCSVTSGLVYFATITWVLPDRAEMRERFGETPGLGHFVDPPVAMKI
jgi:hypothetical protein